MRIAWLAIAIALLMASEAQGAEPSLGPPFVLGAPLDTTPATTGVAASGNLVYAVSIGGGVLTFRRSDDGGATFGAANQLGKNAGFWVRRVLHELAVHRWDAATLVPGPPEPIPSPVAVDGIGEFFDEFVATALARGLVPPAARRLALEITDVDRRLEFPLPDPGPVTTIRGTASDLLLALWRRRDPLSLHVDGDPAVLEAWPSI